MLSKLLSYFIPINVYKKNSALSQSLEVTWNNGELVLDSKNTNYSYGSLQRILRKGLKHVGFEHIQKFERILILGVAGGSVIKTLTDEIQYKGKITGVEIDAAVIEIANQYFNLDKISNLEIMIDDAFEYIFKTNNTYDLIIIDVFQDTTMPDFLFEDKFINRIKELVKKNGYILFNTMVKDKIDEARNQKYESHFNQHFSLKVYPKIEVHNELFIIKKQS